MIKPVSFCPCWAFCNKLDIEYQKWIRLLAIELHERKW